MCGGGGGGGGGRGFTHDCASMLHSIAKGTSCFHFFRMLESLAVCYAARFVVVASLSALLL